MSSSSASLTPSLPHLRALDLCLSTLLASTLTSAKQILCALSQRIFTVFQSLASRLPTLAVDLPSDSLTHLIARRYISPTAPSRPFDDARQLFTERPSALLSSQFASLVRDSLVTSPERLLQVRLQTEICTAAISSHSPLISFSAVVRQY